MPNHDAATEPYPFVIEGLPNLTEAAELVSYLLRQASGLFILKASPFNREKELIQTLCHTFRTHYFACGYKHGRLPWVSELRTLQSDLLPKGLSGAGETLGPRMVGFIDASDLYNGFWENVADLSQRMVVLVSVPAHLFDADVSASVHYARPIDVSLAEPNDWRAYLSHYYDVGSSQELLPRLEKLPAALKASPALLHVAAEAFLSNPAGTVSNSTWLDVILQSVTVKDPGLQKALEAFAWDKFVSRYPQLSLTADGVRPDQLQDLKAKGLVTQDEHFSQPYMEALLVAKRSTEKNQALLILTDLWQAHKPKELLAFMLGFSAEEQLGELCDHFFTLGLNAVADLLHCLYLANLDLPYRYLAFLKTSGFMLDLEALLARIKLPKNVLDYLLSLDLHDGELAPLCRYPFAHAEAYWQLFERGSAYHRRLLAQNSGTPTKLLQKLLLDFQDEPLLLDALARNARLPSSLLTKLLDFGQETLDGTLLLTLLSNPQMSPETLTPYLDWLENFAYSPMAKALLLSRAVPAAWLKEKVDCALKRKDFWTLAPALHNKELSLEQRKTVQAFALTHLEGSANEPLFKDLLSALIQTSERALQPELFRHLRTFWALEKDLVLDFVEADLDPQLLTELLHFARHEPEAKDLLIALILSEDIPYDKVSDFVYANDGAMLTALAQRREPTAHRAQLARSELEPLLLHAVHLTLASNKFIDTQVADTLIDVVSRKPQVLPHFYAFELAHQLAHNPRLSATSVLRLKTVCQDAEFESLSALLERHPNA